MPCHRRGSRVAAAALLAALVGPLLPASGTAATWHIGWPNSVSVHSDDGCELRMRVTGEGRTVKVECDGCYEVDEQERDLVKLEPGRYFKAEERRWGRVRKAIEIRAGADGRLVRRYRVDGEERPFDADAQEWMADILRTVVQHSGSGLDQHILRVFRRDGVDGALREIARSDGDHAQRGAYLELLQAAGGGPELEERIVREAATTIDSDHELAELLVEIAGRAAVTSATLVACAEAAHAVDSGYELRRALTEIVRQDTADARVAAAVLHGALAVDSGHERAEVLLAVTEKFNLAPGVEPAVAPAYFDALRGIDSSYEAARVLGGLLDRKDLEPGVLAGVATAVADLDSDYHKGQVLETMAHRFKLDGPARDAYLETAKGIGSEYHRRQAMEALLDHGL